MMKLYYLSDDYGNNKERLFTRGWPVNPIINS